jgi:hypothetical protein
LIDPEDDGSSDADGGKEGMSASVITGMDAAPVFESAEHVLDLVALTVEGAVVGDWYSAIGLDRMQAMMPRAARALRNQPAS